MSHEKYLQALDAYIRNDNFMLDKFIRGTELGQCELALIKARQEIKRGDYIRAAQLLNGYSPQSNLLKAELFFVRSNLHSYESQWQQAILAGLQAISEYKTCQSERGLFIAHYNVSVYYNRLGLDYLSQFHLLQSEEWIRNSTQRVLVLRARACDFSRDSKFRLAVELIEEALNFIDIIDPVDAASLHSIAADIYFRASLSEKALHHLEKLSNSKIIRDKARVRFDLTVLRALISGEDRYVGITMPKSIADNKEYSLRWNILSSLQAGDLKTSQFWWSQLVSFLPQRFSDNFTTINASDEKTIFMHAINKLRSVSRTKNTPQIQGKPLELYNILCSSEVYLRKEEIIERVWKIDYDPSYDGRFYKLIERLRKDAQIKIEVIMSTYRLSA